MEGLKINLEQLEVLKIFELNYFASIFDVF